MDKKELQIENFNNDFLLLTSKEQRDLTALGKAIFQANFSFADEVIVTETEICIKLNSQFKERDIALLRDLKVKTSKVSQSYKLPVYFGEQEDWNIITAHTGFSKEIVIDKLSQMIFTVAMFGFLPGFTYFKGLGEDLHIPRKTKPAKYVDANSIAIGGQYLGLYAINSPGGWYVIGSTPIEVLSLAELPPVILNLEDEVRLIPIDKEEYLKLKEQSISLLEYNC